MRRRLSYVEDPFLGQPAELAHDGLDVGRAKLVPPALFQPLPEGLHHLDNNAMS